MKKFLMIFLLIAIAGFLRGSPNVVQNSDENTGNQSVTSENVTVSADANQEVVVIAVENPFNQIVPEVAYNVIWPISNLGVNVSSESVAIDLKKLEAAGVQYTSTAELTSLNQGISVEGSMVAGTGSTYT